VMSSTPAASRAPRIAKTVRGLPLPFISILRIVFGAILAALAGSRLPQWRAARAIRPCAATTGFPSRESRAIQRAWHRPVSRIPARTPKDDLPLKMTACEINHRGALVARPTTIISRQYGGYSFATEPFRLRQHLHLRRGAPGLERFDLLATTTVPV
jgi:hypothetical protein